MKKIAAVLPLLTCAHAWGSNNKDTVHIDKLGVLVFNKGAMTAARRVRYSDYAFDFLSLSLSLALCVYLERFFDNVSNVLF